MTDYISREDAIELITDKTKRLALSKEADGYGEVEWSAYVVEKREAIAILNALPAADVVEVIRCKECRYNVANMEKDPYDITDYTDITCTYFMTDGMSANDFCKWGKKV